MYARTYCRCIRKENPPSSMHVYLYLHTFWPNQSIDPHVHIDVCDRLASCWALFSIKINSTERTQCREMAVLLLLVQPR